MNKSAFSRIILRSISTSHTINQSKKQHNAIFVAQMNKNTKNILKLQKNNNKN